MSDTPRTDAIVINGTAERFLRLARQLERELAAANALLAKNEGRVKAIVDAELLQRTEKAEAELAAAQDHCRLYHCEAGALAKAEAERDALMKIENFVGAKDYDALKAELAAAKARCDDLHENGIRLMESADGWKNLYQAEQIVRREAEAENKALREGAK